MGYYVCICPYCKYDQLSDLATHCPRCSFREFHQPWQTDIPCDKCKGTGETWQEEAYTENVSGTVDGYMTKYRWGMLRCPSCGGAKKTSISMDLRLPTKLAHRPVVTIHSHKTLGVRDKDYCIDIPAWRTEDFHIQLWKPVYHPGSERAANQRWQIIRVEGTDDAVYFVSDYRGKALDVRDQGRGENAVVHTHDFDYSRSQQWRLQRERDDNYMIYSLKYGFCLDAQYPGDEERTKLVLWYPGYEGGQRKANQLWWLKPV